MMHYLFSRQHSFAREYREVYFAGETQNNQPENNEQRVEPTTERQNDAADLNASNVDQRSPEAAKKVIKATGDRQQQNQNILTNINGSLRKMTPQRTPEQLQKIQESKQRVADLKARKAQLQAMSPEQRAVFLQKEMAQKTEKRKQEMAANTQEDDSDVPNQVFINVPPEQVPPNGPNQQPQGPNNAPPQQLPAPPNAPNNQPLAGTDQSKLTQAERDQIIADAKADLGDLNALKKMKPEERDKKIAEVQAKHGVEVTEENGTYKVDVAESKGDVAMNKMMGQFMKLALVLQRFKKMFDKMLGKKESKDEEEKQNLEEAKSRVKDRLDKGERPEDIRADADNRKTDAANDLQKIDAAKRLHQSDKQKYQQEIDAKKQEIGNASDADKPALERHLQNMLNDMKRVEEKGKLLNEQEVEAKGKISDAENDIKALDEIKKESETAKVNSIPKDGKWHSATEVKDGKQGWSYKVAKDGRSYSQNGDKLQVFSGDKWVDAALDAGIKDPTVQQTYRDVFKRGGDKGWVVYGVSRYSYSIDPATKTLISSSNFGNYQEYQPGINQWQPRAKYEPS